MHWPLMYPHSDHKAAVLVKGSAKIQSMRQINKNYEKHCAYSKSGKHFWSNRTTAKYCCSEHNSLAFQERKKGMGEVEGQLPEAEDVSSNIDVELSKDLSSSINILLPEETEANKATEPPKGWACYEEALVPCSPDQKILFITREEEAAKGEILIVNPDFLYDLKFGLEFTTCGIVMGTCSM